MAEKITRDEKDRDGMHRELELIRREKTKTRTLRLARQEIEYARFIAVTE